MDLMGGVLVHAAGGVRACYRPVRSSFLRSADPVHFVNVFQEKAGVDAFYIADLDAIMGGHPQDRVIEALLERTEAHFWLDGGYRRLTSAFQDSGRITPVIATETFLDWDRVQDLSGVMVSIDTKHGRFYCARAGMPLGRVLARARAAAAKGFIHMRLEAMGAGGFDPFTLIPPRPGERWHAAGGIRGPEDMSSLAEAGYAGALVSTALLEGRL